MNTNERLSDSRHFQLFKFWYLQFISLSFSLISQVLYYFDIFLFIIMYFLIIYPINLLLDGIVSRLQANVINR